MFFSARPHRCAATMARTAGDGTATEMDDGIASGSEASPSAGPCAGEDSKNARGLASHIRSVAWEEQDFSDVVVTALGKEYPLHRLVLSRSPYFRALMRGPWADAASNRLSLDFDDGLVDDDAVKVRLAPEPNASARIFFSSDDAPRSSLSHFFA